MRFVLSLILCLVLVADANACVFGFRLFRRPAVVGKSQKVAPVKSAVQKSTAVQKSDSVQKSGSASDICLRKCQVQAARGRMFHVGGGFGPGRAEGVGFSSRSAADALANCCFTGKRVCIGSAVVRGKNGWYATKIYR